MFQIDVDFDVVFRSSGGRLGVAFGSPFDTLGGHRSLQVDAKTVTEPASHRKNVLFMEQYVFLYFFCLGRLLKIK